MTRDEAERTISAMREHAKTHGFCNRNIRGSMVQRLLEAHDVIAGELVKRETYRGTPTRPIQPGRPVV